MVYIFRRIITTFPVSCTSNIYVSNSMNLPLIVPRGVKYILKEISVITRNRDGAMICKPRGMLASRCATIGFLQRGSLRCLVLNRLLIWMSASQVGV